MFNLNEIRWICSLETYDEMNLFQRIVFKIKLKKQLKKDLYYTKKRESLKIPDMNFNDYLSKYFKR